MEISHDEAPREPRLLDTIDDPTDLKGLSSEQLERLADEIREELVGTVSQTGGHLSSNLGVVELTLALHTVFDSPRDKLVWDVGHQAYVHKLLTGRRDRFHTIRQTGGLSGYTTRKESPHDPFGAAHASTSISAAAGMAVARDLKGEDHHVVAVIGDGALTGGMALEALNNVGHLRTRMIIVLNDNQMSISPNVGAVNRSFYRLRLDSRYRWAKEEAEQVVTKLPMGKEMWDTAKRFRASFKRLILPTLFFEELGYTYIGVIDGHNVDQLLEALAHAKTYTDKPVIIHVLTTKGYGYDKAEADATKYHGVAPPGAKASAPSYSKVFGDTVSQLMRADPSVVAITAAMLEGTGLASTVKEFPKRVFDVGICEQHAVTFAGGLATQGMRPIAAIYSTFLQRAYDQIIHDVCIQNLPVLFALDRGGLVPDDGPTHQGAFDLAYLRCVPNIVVCAPRDENELRHLLQTGIKHAGPFAVRYPRGAGVGVPLDPELRELPIGQGELLRAGDDVLLLAIGATVYPALEAAEKLADEQGMRAAVIDARFAKPLDAALIAAWAERTGNVVTVEENALMGGFGSAVLELLSDRGLNRVHVARIGVRDEFMDQATTEELRARIQVDADGICQHVCSLLAVSQVEGEPVPVRSPRRLR